MYILKFNRITIVFIMMISVFRAAGWTQTEAGYFEHSSGQLQMFIENTDLKNTGIAIESLSGRVIILQLSTENAKNVRVCFKGYPAEVDSMDINNRMGEPAFTVNGKHNLKITPDLLIQMLTAESIHKMRETKIPQYKPKNLTVKILESGEIAFCLMGGRVPENGFPLAPKIKTTLDEYSANPPLPQLAEEIAQEPALDTPVVELDEASRDTAKLGEASRDTAKLGEASRDTAKLGEASRDTAKLGEASQDTEGLGVFAPKDGYLLPSPISKVDLIEPKVELWLNGIVPPPGLEIPNVITPPPGLEELLEENQNEVSEEVGPSTEEAIQESLGEINEEETLSPEEQEKLKLTDYQKWSRDLIKSAQQAALNRSSPNNHKTHEDLCIGPISRAQAQRQAEYSFFQAQYQYIPPSLEAPEHTFEYQLAKGQEIMRKRQEIWAKNRQEELIREREEREERANLKKAQKMRKEEMKREAQAALQASSANAAATQTGASSWRPGAASSSNAGRAQAAASSGPLAPGVIQPPVNQQWKGGKGGWKRTK